MTEQGRHRGFAALGLSVHLDQFTALLAPLLLLFIDAAGELRLARAGRPTQQYGIAGGDGDLLDALDQAVVGGVSGLDTCLQERQGLRPLLLESSRDAVVARQIEIDDGVSAEGAAARVRGGRGLDQARRDVP